MENKQIIVNETLISYVSAGKGERSLIFLHGWRSSKEAWMPIAEHIEQCGYRILFIDFPGFGASEAPNKPYNLHDYAETVRAFAEKLDIKIAAVIGHSFGARVAIKLAEEHPHLLEKLVLVASGGKRASFLTIKSFAAKLAKPFFIPRFMAPLRKKMYGIMGADDYLVTTELQTTFANIIHENLDALLPRIHIKTLVVWGDKDEMAPLEYGRHMAQLLPNAQLEIINGAGHYCFSEKSEKFIDLILKFLK